MIRGSVASSRIGRSLGYRTTPIKWAVILLLNLTALGTLAVISPGASPWEASINSLTYTFFPGGLYVIGDIIAAILQAILKPNVLGFLFLFNLIATIPLLFGGRFIQQLYEFRAFGLALGYLVDAFLVPAYYYLDLQPGRDAPHPDYRRGAGGPRIAVIRNGQLVPAGKHPRNHSIALAGGPGIVVIPPEYALQLERDGRLGYVVGPGIVRLGRFEKAYKPVNLRQIVRKKSAQALTRDGIPVTVEVTVQARIRASAQPTKRNPYPFNNDAIRRLIVTTPARESGLVPWEERPTMLVNGVLNEVLAKYRLDELFDPLDNDLQTPRPTIHDEIWRTLRQRARGFGVEITELWLGEFQLPDKVTAQYMAYWQSDWQSKDRTRRAHSEASFIRTMNRARADAQREFIETLVAAFQAAQDANLDISPKQLAALRLIDGLEQIYRKIDQGEEDPNRRMLTMGQHLARLRDTIQIEEQRIEETEPDAGS
jgi:regulator of protease activity HflC (stomatin/prohibitin superfamily)